MIKKDFSVRGFNGYEFDGEGYDDYIIQKSSSCEPHIWLGVHNVKQKYLDPGSGWVEIPIHPDILMNGKMHLSQEQVKELIPILQYFVDNGKIPKELFKRCE